MREALFYGGPLDGQVLELAGEQNYWEAIIEDDRFVFYRWFKAGPSHDVYIYDEEMSE